MNTEKMHLITSIGFLVILFSFTRMRVGPGKTACDTLNASPIDI